MAITNYTNLKTSIADWSHRTDVTSLIDDFIDLAEAEMWKKLRIKEMDIKATDTASTISRLLALPTGFIQMRKISLFSGGIEYGLRSRVPEAMKIRTTAGRPDQYTITSQIEFDRTADTGYTVEIQHYAKPTALSAANATNSVITNYPSIYLYGALWKLWEWALDFDKAAQWRSAFENAVADANKEAKSGQYGSAPVSRVETSTP